VYRRIQSQRKYISHKYPGLKYRDTQIRQW
jgi:hypothetical protein